MFSRKGLIVDKEKKRYKTYVSFLFYEIGDWKPLPEISFIALTEVLSVRNLNNPQGVVASVSLKGKLFYVYLCVDKKIKIIVNKNKRRKDTLALAIDLSNYLEVPLRNYIKE